MSRLRDLVREWDAETGHRLRRLARMPDYFPLPPSLATWEIAYDALDFGGKKWSPQYLWVSRVTTGIGRSLVSSVEDLQLEAGISIVEVWVGGLLYVAPRRPVPSFGARWRQGADLFDQSVPA